MEFGVGLAVLDGDADELMELGDGEDGALRIAVEGALFGFGCVGGFGFCFFGLGFARVLGFEHKAAVDFDLAIFDRELDGVAEAMEAALGGSAIAEKALAFEVLFVGPGEGRAV